MKFLSFDIIKGEDLCYCNVEAKFCVEKLFKITKKVQQNIFFKISPLRPLVLKARLTNLCHEANIFCRISFLKHRF